MSRKRDILPDTGDKKRGRRRRPGETRPTGRPLGTIDVGEWVAEPLPTLEVDPPDRASIHLVALHRLTKLVRGQRPWIVAGQSGNATAGAWQTRDLTSLSGSGDPAVSLASNQVTLATGTYFVAATAPAYRVEQHQTRWYNATTGSAAFYGTSEMADGANNRTASRSMCEGEVTVAGAIETFELQHRFTSTRLGDGLGREVSTDNVYSLY